MSLLSLGFSPGQVGAAVAAEREGSSPSGSIFQDSAVKQAQMLFAGPASRLPHAGLRLSSSPRIGLRPMSAPLGMPPFSLSPMFISAGMLKADSRDHYGISAARYLAQQVASQKFKDLRALEALKNTPRSRSRCSSISEELEARLASKTRFASLDSVVESPLMPVVSNESQFSVVSLYSVDPDSNMSILSSNESYVWDDFEYNASDDGSDLLSHSADENVTDDDVDLDEEGAVVMDSQFSIASLYSVDVDSDMHLLSAVSSQEWQHLSDQDAYDILSLTSNEGALSDGWAHLENETPLRAVDTKAYSPYPDASIKGSLPARAESPNKDRCYARSQLSEVGQIAGQELPRGSSSRPGLRDQQEEPAHEGPSGLKKSLRRLAWHLSQR